MSAVVGEQVPNGYKQTEAGVIPSDWVVKSLSQLTLDMLQGVNTAIDIPEYVESGVPMLKANNVIDQVVKFQGCDSISRRTYDGYSERFKIKRNDFLFSNIGARLGTGSLLEDNIECSFAWNIMRIVPDQKKVIPRFLAFQINSPKHSEKIKSEQSGSGMGFIPKTTMLNVHLPLPEDLEEQTAIANALSDVDALITSLEKLIAKKRAIKTAAMQQLLTGKKRLPPFDQAHTGYKQTELGEIPEDWEVKSYGQAFNFLTTASNSRSDLHDDGDYQYIHYGDIHVKWDSIVNFSADQIPRINSSNVSNATLLKDGDLIMADASEDYDGIGKSVEVAGLGRVKAVSGLHTILLRDVGVFAEGYRGFLHQIKSTKQSFDRLATGLKVYGLSKGNLKSVLLPVPPKEEQSLITEVLSDMAGEIDSLNERLAKTQQLKQGMMQELLTGRTRLV